MLVMCIADATPLFFEYFSYQNKRKKVAQKKENYCYIS